MALIKRPTTTPSTKGKTSARTGGFAFKYKQRTPEEVRDRATRSIGGRDSYFKQEVKYFTPREGVNNIRILPPPPDADWGHYGIGIFVHYDIGVDGSAYLCLAKMKGEDCPACEERARASSTGEEDLAKQLRPGERVAVYVIDRSKEGDGPLLWNLPSNLDKDITKLCIDPGTGEVLYPDNPEEGYDLSFTREGQGLKTKYKGIQFSRRTSPLSDDPKEGDAWLQYICDHAIDSMLQYFEYDYMESALNGTAAAVHTPAAPKEEPAADPSVTPRKAIQRPGKKAAPEPEPEPEPSAEEGEEVPSWEDIEGADEDALVALIETFELTPPDDGFDSEDALRDWVAEQLGVEKPAPAPAAAKVGSWKDRLKGMQKK